MIKEAIANFRIRHKGKKYLEKHPLCPICLSEGYYRRATTVLMDTDGDLKGRCNAHRVPDYRYYLNYGMPKEIYHRGGDTDGRL